MRLPTVGTLVDVVGSVRYHAVPTVGAFDARDAVGKVRVGRVDSRSPSCVACAPVGATSVGVEV